MGISIVQACTYSSSHIYRENATGIKIFLVMYYYIHSKNKESEGKQSEVILLFFEKTHSLTHRIIVDVTNTNSLRFIKSTKEIKAKMSKK